MSRGGWNQNWSMCSGGSREAYRDLAHIIHERFCYNRRSAALVCEASFVKQFRNLLTC
jgi:hypothetical protein